MALFERVQKGAIPDGWGSSTMGWITSTFRWIHSAVSLRSGRTCAFLLEQWTTGRMLTP